MDLQGDLEKFVELDIQVIAITTDSLDSLREAADENRISKLPMLSDSTGEVSKAYDVLGRGMHSDKPGHTFVLIDRQGLIRWRKDYSEMYVPNEDLLEAIRQALAA